MKSINNNIILKAKDLYKTFGQTKSINNNLLEKSKPKFFLHRKFSNEQDMLIIFNTNNCKFNCNFCNLSDNSIGNVSGNDILCQFDYVLNECKHSLSIIERFTLSNNASVLNDEIFSNSTLINILKAINQIKSVKNVVLESNMIFINNSILEILTKCLKRAKINILTGFETYSDDIKEHILNKPENKKDFEKGLDILAKYNVDLTVYLLYKPSYFMTDKEAYLEAMKTYHFINDLCRKKNINYTLRINPMYAAKESKWSKTASNLENYKPPDLIDVLNFATELKNNGTKVFVGLSTEGLSENWGNFKCRDSYSTKLLNKVNDFNKNIF